MPSKYKLTYFNARGMAESSRWILALGGQEYEDVRFKDREEWMALKPNTPLGQAPILEVDGKQLSQTKAICRYLAKQFGYLGKTDWDQARADMLVDYVDDMRAPLFAIFGEQDEDKKAQLREKYVKEQMPTFLTVLERNLKENNEGDGFFVGDQVTWADVYFTTFIMAVELGAGKVEIGDLMASYPKLKALCNRVRELPAIAKWIKERPQTDS